MLLTTHARRRSPLRLTAVMVGAASLVLLVAPSASAVPAAAARSTFSGSVLDSAGDPVQDSGLSLTLVNAANSHKVVPVQADGSFTVIVAPGLFTLAISGRAADALSLSVTSAKGALDLTSSQTENLTLPTATLTAQVDDDGGQPIPGAQLALVSPGCKQTSFEVTSGLTLTGKWDEGGAPAAVTDDNGTATRTVLPCSVTTTYSLTPPSDGGVSPRSVVVAAHTGDVTVPVTLFPKIVDRAAAAGLYAVNMTWSAKTVDYNNDGLEDVWIGYHQRSGKLWQNNGDGTYTQVATDAWPAKNPDGTSTDRHDCDWADVDGNGLPDAACSAGRDKQNYVKPANRDNELWLQLTPGHFTDVGTEWGLGDPCGRGRHVAFIDANGDGWPDLFVGNEAPRGDPNDPCNDPANNLPNQQSKFYLNMDGKGFQYAPDFFDPGYVGQRCAKVFDYNGDGWPDLLTCNNKDQPPSLFRNDDGAGFTLVSSQVGLTDDATDVDVVDFNGDGTPDVVTCTATGFSYQLNDGGTFAAPVSIYQSTKNGAPTAVSVGDIDGNGTLDVYAMFGPKNSGGNADDLVLLNTPDGFVPETVPSAFGKADHVLALHPNGPSQPAQFLVLNGYQSNEIKGTGGPIQLITAAS